MTQPNKFKNESQDARRHDQQHAVHPDEKKNASKNKSDKNGDKKTK
jgi:hypothetical protein